MAVNYTPEGKLDLTDPNAETMLAFFKLVNEKEGKPITPETIGDFFTRLPEFRFLQDDVEALLFGNAKRGFRWNLQGGS